jgi:hypothetical protein
LAVELKVQSIQDNFEFVFGISKADSFKSEYSLEVLDLYRMSDGFDGWFSIDDAEYSGCCSLSLRDYLKRGSELI